MDTQGMRPLLSYDERYEMGKALREKTPRSSHGPWEPPSDRRDPVELIEETNRDRVPDLVPIRYGRMLKDPFAFLRGSAALMAADLSTTLSTGIRVQACGDCHLANFGLFATPERNLVFDLNDFDETLPAPWEWDVKRLAASFVVAGRARGLKDPENEAAVQSLSRSYRANLDRYAKMRVLDVWYARIDDSMLIATAPDAQVRQNRKQISAKARSSVAEYLFPKIATIKGGRCRIVDKPPLIFHLPELSDIEDRLARLQETYRDSLPTHFHRCLDHYRFVDYAFKVVGVGSVGTRCYVLLFQAGKNDPLLLQVKEAKASVLEPYASKSEFDHHGRRIVIGQRLTQAASDMFLGSMTGEDGTHYYVRQLRDMKFSVPLDNFSAKGLTRYAEICGWALARAHAKGGDAAVISGYLGKNDAFDRALTRFGRAYADQTAADFDKMAAAARTGRIHVVLDT